MKTNKKWLSLLLAMVMVVSILPFTASAATTWSDADITWTDVTGVGVGADGKVTVQSVEDAQGTLWVTEYWADLRDLSTSGYNYFYARENSGYYSPLVAFPNAQTGLANLNLYCNNTDSANNRSDQLTGVKLGQRIHTLAVYDISAGNISVWVNGVKWKDLTGKRTGFTSLTYRNVDGAKYAFVGKTGHSLSDFNASAYDVHITSTDSNVTLSGARDTDMEAGKNAVNFAVNVKGKYTADELKSKLTASNANASIKVLNASDGEVAGTEVVKTGYKVQVTSANGSVIVKYDVTVDLSWPDAPVSYTGSNDAISFSNQIATGLSDSNVYVINYTYTPNAATAAVESGQLKAVGGMLYWKDNGGWTPIAFRNDGIYSNYVVWQKEPGEFNKKIGAERVGESYHVTGVISKQGGSGLAAKVFINGAEVPMGGYINTGVYGTSGFDVKIGSNKGVEITLEQLPNTVTKVADFDYSDYEAQVTATSSELTITGDKAENGALFANFGITVASKKSLTVNELLAGLNAPIDVTPAVYASAAAIEPMEGSEIVTDGAVLKTTSKNGIVSLSYVIDVIDTSIVDEIIIEGKTATVIGSAKDANLYIAAFEGETLKAVALGTKNSEKPYELVAELPLDSIDGMTVKAFYWTKNLVPIAMK